MTRMKRTLVGALLACFGGVFAAAREADEGSGVSIGVDAGTLGLGVTAGYNLPSLPLAVRGRYSRLDYGYDRRVSGNEYEGDLELESFGVLLDWFPTSSGFRVTGGVLWNGNAVAASSDSSNLGIGETSYSGTLSVEVELGDQIAPYLGLGWRGGQPKGVGFSIEAGALFQGAPSVSAAGSLASSEFGTCTFTVSSAGAVALGGNLCESQSGARLIANIQAEHENLSDDFDDMKVWPVLLVGVSKVF